jgi:hypothetical protein
LIQNGVEKSRLSFKGFGNLRPFVKETRTEEELQNRRVEISVLSKEEKSVSLPMDYRRVEDINMPLRGIEFIPNKAGLYPSGRFMLKLLAESISESSGVHHEIQVNINDLNDRLAENRIQEIRRQLHSFGCSESQYSVIGITPNIPRGRSNRIDLFVRMFKLQAER